MGKIKELAIEIEDMLLNGYDAEDVSLILGVDIKLVQGFIVDADKTVNETHDEY